MKINEKDIYAINSPPQPQESEDYGTPAEIETPQLGALLSGKKSQDAQETKARVSSAKKPEFKLPLINEEDQNSIDFIRETNRSLEEKYDSNSQLLDWDKKKKRTQNRP